MGPMQQQERLGANRAAMERMLHIHKLLKNAEYPNSPKLAREFEVVKRTVKRDIEFMRDRHGAPIEYDEIRHDTRRKSKSSR